MNEPSPITADMPETKAAPEFKFNALSSKELKDLSRHHLWSLNEAELSAIQTYCKAQRREPTLAEIETLAQCWSEHCRHKTFTGPIRYSEDKKNKTIKNLFQETIVKATKELNKSWCLSVFKDNAGIVSFGKSKRWALAFKAETHNHPCALEPYGGAQTGLGGVIRDVLAAGLGAKPVLATDVFCFAPPDYEGALPEGSLHPKRSLTSVVAGVRDYGNRMGIPTAGGAIWFDKDYRLNPLVFVGTVGLMPAWAVKKEIKPGDLIVAAGGRTGKDGIHGATFSSIPLEDSTTSTMQIGHAINEKKLLDALLAARDKKLYRGVTDCGAGGFSCAVTEMAESCGGARVRLEQAKLKVTALKPWEIWLSESQERMVMAVPPQNLKALQEIFDANSCEISVLGEFNSSGRIVVTHGEQPIVDLSLKFISEGLPRIERQAVWKTPKPAAKNGSSSKTEAGKKNPADILKAILSHPNVCSREWVIRQYDHEVQGGTIIKPLQGVRHDGPGDACVIWPQAATGDMEDFAGFAVSHGINPSYGKADPYWMALACADESLRNLLCVGADITQAAFLDNFCWGNPEEPEKLGALVRAALGCYDAAKGFSAPFISGKDSFYNEAKDLNGKSLAIPGTLLISAVAPVSDVRKTLTMDIKGPGNALYLTGCTGEDFDGTLYQEVTGLSGDCAKVPHVEPRQALASFKAIYAAIAAGLILSAHDLSDGGLAAAAAEMTFSGEFGAHLDLDKICRKASIYSNDTLLFSESPSRILLEVSPEKESAFLKALKGTAARRIGTTVANPILKVLGLEGIVILEEPLAALKTAWQRTLPEVLK